MNSHGLYGVINSPGRVTKHSREEYISPDKKSKYFSEKYEWQSEVRNDSIITFPLSSYIPKTLK